MFSTIFIILLVVLVLVVTYLNFQTEINPNHVFIVELIHRFLK